MPRRKAIEMTTTHLLNRRSLMLGMGSFAATTLAGCSSTATPETTRLQSRPGMPSPQYLAMYAAMPEERFPIPRAEIELIDPQYYRQVVDNPTGERPGTVVIDTSNRFLYLVQDGGKALRYGIGIGRDGFSWSGEGIIQFKREWPVWTPPAEMIEREPELEEFRNGMQPGLDNPLGARALYIFQNGRDTLYRLHGNPEIRTIGQAVSSGCIRLINQDVIDLYGRVPPRTKIVVA